MRDSLRTGLAVVVLCLVLAQAAAVHAQWQAPAWAECPNVELWMKWDLRRVRDFYNDVPYYQGLFRPGNQPTLYHDAGGYTAALPPLTLADFEALPAAERDRRRDLARKDLGFVRRLGADLAEQSQLVAAEMRPGVLQVRNIRFTPRLLRSLRNAGGLDPSNPYVWHSLSYFHGMVGDRERADEALSATFAALDRIPPEALPETRRRAALDRAWLLREDGLFEESLLWVERADPDGRLEEALLLRGLCHAQLGNEEEANSYAERLNTVEVRKYPFSLDASNRARTVPGMIDPVKWNTRPSDFAAGWIRALSYLHQGELKLANHVLGEPRRADLYPYARYYWSDAGMIMELTDQPGRAMVYYGLAMVHHPYLEYFAFETVNATISDVGNPGAGLVTYLGYAEYYLTGSRFSYATSLTLLAMHDFDPVMRARFADAALNELEACIRRGIRPLESQALRARLLHLRGDLDAASRAFTSVIDLLYSLELASPVFLLQAAMNDLRREVPTTALIKLDRARTMTSGSPMLARTRAVALLRQGYAEPGRQELDRALVLDSGAWTAWLNRGLLSLREGRLDAAAIDSRRAAELAPGSSRVAALVAAVARARDAATPGVIEPIGDVATAPYYVEDEEAMTSPLTSISRRRLIEYRERHFSDREVTDPYAWLGDVAGDEKTLRKAYRNDPSDFNRQNLARELIRSGEPEEGRALLLETWSEASPVVTHNLLLESDRLLEDTTRARRWASDLQEGSPPNENPYFWSLVAVICLDNGLDDLGARALDKALILDPGNPGLQMYRNLLGS